MKSDNLKLINTAADKMEALAVKKKRDQERLQGKFHWVDQQAATHFFMDTTPSLTEEMEDLKAVNGVRAKLGKDNPVFESTI